MQDYESDSDHSITVDELEEEDWFVCFSNSHQKHHMYVNKESNY